MATSVCRRLKASSKASCAIPDPTQIGMSFGQGYMGSVGVFRSGCSDPLLTRAVAMELKACNGWDHTHPLDEVQLEMRHRVRVKGWDSVKPAMRSSIQCVNPILVSIFELRSTFREWIMFAFCAHVLDHDSVIALEFYTKAIAMIDFVRATWPDVPTSERGVICKTSFLFPLKRLALRAYLDVRAVILHRFSRANSTRSVRTPCALFRSTSCRARSIRHCPCRRSGG